MRRRRRFSLSFACLLFAFCFCRDSGVECGAQEKEIKFVCFHIFPQSSSAYTEKFCWLWTFFLLPSAAALCISVKQIKLVICSAVPPTPPRSACPTTAITSKMTTRRWRWWLWWYRGQSQQLATGSKNNMKTAKVLILKLAHFMRITWNSVIFLLKLKTTFFKPTNKVGCWCWVSWEFQGLLCCYQSSQSCLLVAQLFYMLRNQLHDKNEHPIISNNIFSFFLLVIFFSSFFLW